MEHFTEIDVSLDSSSVCIVDRAGKVAREAKVASEPEALIAWLHELGLGLERIGMEAGPLSQWLRTGMREAGGSVKNLGQPACYQATSGTQPVPTLKTQPPPSC